MSDFGVLTEMIISEVNSFVKLKYFERMLSRPKGWSLQRCQSRLSRTRRRESSQARCCRTSSLWQSRATACLTLTHGCSSCSPTDYTSHPSPRRPWWLHREENCVHFVLWKISHVPRVSHNCCDPVQLSVSGTSRRVRHESWIRYVVYRRLSEQEMLWLTSSWMSSTCTSSTLRIKRIVIVLLARHKSWTLRRNRFVSYHPSLDICCPSSTCPSCMSTVSFNATIVLSHIILRFQFDIRYHRDHYVRYDPRVLTLFVSTSTSQFLIT